MKKLLFILPVLSIAFLACEKDDVDTSVPTIDIVSPIMEQEFEPHDEIAVQAIFTDNEELKSYKIDIHFAGEHDHTKKSADSEEGHPWTYEKSFDFEAGLKEITISDLLIEVPDSVMGEEGKFEPIAHGEYHFGVVCTDVAGNEAHQFVDIIIEAHDH